MTECTICFEIMQLQTDKLTMCYLCGRLCSYKMLYSMEKEIWY